MCDEIPTYKYSILGEAYGNVLAPKDAKLVAVADGPVVDPLPTTDSLMQSIIERLPEPVDATL